MKMKYLLSLLLAICLLLAACSTPNDTTAGNDDAVITLDTASVSLTPGGTCKISYSVEPENTAITFSSSDASVAAVSEDGTVTAVSSGSTVVAVSAGEYSKAYFEVTVSPASMQPVPNLLLNCETVELIEDATFDIACTAKNGVEEIDGCTINWASSDEKVAGVENGKVTAIAEGEAVITASADIGGIHAETSCNVKVYPFYHISISEPTVYAAIGEEFTLEAIVTDKDGNIVTPEPEELELFTSDENSVQVTENNTFKVVGIGDTGAGVRYKGNNAMIPVDIFSVTADFFSDSCTDFYGEIGGETVCAVKYASSIYQPHFHLTEDGVARLHAYAEEHGYDTVTLRTYAILKDNGFVISLKYWFPNNAWGELKVKISDLTTEADFWSQSQGATEVYMVFLFE